MPDIERFIVHEKESRFYDLTFTDQTGTQIALASMSALTLSLFLKDSDPIIYINSRNGQNILNANNVTIDSAGKITWAIQPADSAMQNADAQVEVHVAIFTLTTTGGTPLTVRHEAHMYVDNLEPVS